MNAWIAAAWVAAGAIVTVLLVFAAVFWARNEWRRRHGERGGAPGTARVERDVPETPPSPDQDHPAPPS
jgi:hypothetical protein